MKYVCFVFFLLTSFPTFAEQIIKCTADNEQATVTIMLSQYGNTFNYFGTIPTEIDETPLLAEESGNLKNSLVLQAARPGTWFKMMIPYSVLNVAITGFDILVTSNHSEFSLNGEYFSNCVSTLN